MPMRRLLRRCMSKKYKSCNSKLQYVCFSCLFCRLRRCSLFSLRSLTDCQQLPLPASLGVTDVSLIELDDPNPSIHALFVYFNAKFFFNTLHAVEVKWSKR